LIASASIVAIMQSGDNLQTDIINISNPSETQVIDILNIIKAKEEPKVIEPSEGKNPYVVNSKPRRPGNKRVTECSTKTSPCTALREDFVLPSKSSTILGRIAAKR